MIKVWRCSIIRPKALLLGSQALLWAMTLSIASWDSHKHSFSDSVLLSNFGLILLLLALHICAYFNGLDALIVGPSFRQFVIKASASFAMGLALTVPLFVALPTLFPAYAWVLLSVMLTALMLFVLRAISRWLFRRRQFVEGLLILGTGDLAKKFYDEVSSGRATRSQLLLFGAVSDSLAESFPDSTGNFPESGAMINYSQLREIALAGGISRIVVADPNAQNSTRLSAALLDCKLLGLEVEQAADSYEKLSGRIWLEGLRPEWLVYSEGFQPPKYYPPLKRVCDVGISLALLVAAAPACALIALLIRLESPGPALFRQVRVGRNGKEFELIKFRTMRQDAESSTGPVWAKEHDDRITPLGNFLRKVRLDELPQAWNVLRGEMSLIGPRPERPHFVSMLNERVPFYSLRHCIKPGITGWAQVLYHYGASVADAYEKMQYDLYYAKHMSLRFDLKILFQTVRVVLFGRGR